MNDLSWDDFWSKEYRTVNCELQLNLNSHQGKITFDLLKKYKEKSRILDAGCGLGNWTFIFEKMRFKAIGIDLSLRPLKIANEYSQKNSLNSNFLLADVRNIPFKDNQFDIIINHGVIEHFSNPKSALIEFYRVLKLKGSCLVTTPNPFSFHQLIGRHILSIIKNYKFGYAGYEKAFTPRKLALLLKETNFININSGILSEGEGTLFGVFWLIIPIFGKIINRFLTKIAHCIEKNQNVIGGGSYAIGYKEKL